VAAKTDEVLEVVDQLKLRRMLGGGVLGGVGGGDKDATFLELSLTSKTTGN